MAITSNDIKLFQAQDNTDNASGGGSRTNIEIVDGDVNNLFPDISRIDTVSGDVALRKVFPTVTTSNRDVYYGAHSIIRKVPTDPKVSALLFHTDDPNDFRLEAQDKIESYVVQSYLESFWLYGNHIAGAKAVTFLQDLASTPPDVGEVYMLTEEGLGDQYIRITSVEYTEVTLYYTHSTVPVEYKRRRIICEIDQPLIYGFTGSYFNPTGQIPNTCDTYATQIADAAKFYSTKSLEVAAEIGDSSIKVDSIYTQLVPAAKKETPLINQDAISNAELVITGTEAQRIGYYVAGSFGSGDQYVIPYSITPGSVSDFIQANSTDNGLGEIYNTGQNKIADVDYEKGIFTIYSGMNGTVKFSFIPATPVATNLQESEAIKITQENRSLTYVRNIPSEPAPGQLYIDYRASGKWYRVISNQDQSIGGESAVGAGAVFINGDGTASVSITLSSLPDLDSSVIFTWGTTGAFEDRTVEASESQRLQLVFPLNQTNIVPTSVNFKYYNATYALFRDATINTDLTINDPNGAITGYLDAIKGEIVITGAAATNTLRSPSETNKTITIDFDYQSTAENLTYTTSSYTVDAGNNNQTTFAIGDTVHLAHKLVSVSFSISMNGVTGLTKVTLYSDINGNLRELSTYGGNILDSTIRGTIDSSGNVTLYMRSRQGVLYNIENYSFGAGARYQSTAIREVPVGDISVNYYNASPNYGSINSVQLLDNIENLGHYRVNIFNGLISEVTFRSIYLGLTSTNFANGTFKSIGNELHHAFDGDNGGASTQIGTIDKAEGVIEFAYIDNPETFLLKFTQLVTSSIVSSGEYNALNATFRTAANKLTTSSFQLRYTSVNGAYSATTDQNGVITGTDIDSVESYIDTETGMAYLIFTAEVEPSSLKYDAVAETSLPLDPELLGLNPVRLPSDGRVPVFKPGYHLVIFNEVTTATTNATPLANDVETLGRSGQAHIEVIDANGKRLNPLQYTADRVAGTVTFSPTLVLEDKYNQVLTAPFYIIDRVEDMLLATDVDISGAIALSAGLSHDFPQGSKVASTLVWGDTGARVYNLFSQEYWDSGNPTWSNDRIGDNTTAQYDNLNNPIQIDNESSTAGRWAVIFKSSTTVDVVHEKLGVVQSNVSISIDDVEPINPATGSPYFTMLKEGFGGGWATNNVIRLNTDSGDNNMWVIRTVQSGALSELTDSIDIEVRGDAN